MRVIQLSDECYNLAIFDNPNPTVDIIREKRIAFLKTLTTSIDLGYLSKVNYDTKTDRYVASFGGDNRTANLKCSNEVATFLTTHLRKHGTWQGRIEEGVLVEVDLLQP